MSKKLVLLFGLVAVFNLFLYHSFGSLGFVVASTALYLFVLGIFWNGRLPIIPTIFIGLLSLSMIRSANELINLLDILAILVTIIWTGFLLAAKRSNFSGAGEFLLVPVSLLDSYLFSILNIFQAPKSKTNIIPLFRGLILGLPILIVLLGLLAGDPAYGHFLKSSLSNSGRLVSHVVFTMLFLGFFLPYTFLKLRELPKKIYAWTLPVAFEVSVITGLIAIVLGSFLIIQWPYIFASVPKETQLVELGVQTYSEYVRRGFGEFVLVAAIIYGVAWAGVWVKKVPIWLQVLLMGEFFLFITSIFRRIALYVQYHGWTLARIYGGFFLLWVLGLTIILIYRISSKKNLFNYELIFSALLFLVFSFFNAEKFLVWNSPPTVNNRIDYVYLARLSPDGFEGWQKAQDALQKGQLEKEEAVTTERLLNSRRESLKRHQERSRDWLDKIFSYNYSLSLASQ